MDDETLQDLAQEAAEDGEWKVDNEEWNGTPYGVIRGAQGEVVIQEPVEFSAYASGAFITPAKMEATLESIAKMHNAFPSLVKAIAAAREEGRAAGYAEAIEQAAKVAEAEYDRLYRSHRDADLPGMEAARSIENAIRALAPADKEPK